MPIFNALAIYHRMEAEGAQRDDVSNLLAITASLEKGDVERAQSICHGIQLTADSDIALRTTMIECYGHCRDTERMAAVWDEIDDDKKTIVTVSAMMEALSIS